VPWCCFSRCLPRLLSIFVWWHSHNHNFTTRNRGTSKVVSFDSKGLSYSTKVSSDLFVTYRKCLKQNTHTRGEAICNMQYSPRVFFLCSGPKKLAPSLTALVQMIALRAKRAGVRRFMLHAGCWLASLQRPKIQVQCAQCTVHSAQCACAAARQQIFGRVIFSVYTGVDCA
jgi:hypothetical protein